MFWFVSYFPFFSVHLSFRRCFVHKCFSSPFNIVAVGGYFFFSLSFVFYSFRFTLLQWVGTGWTGFLFEQNPVRLISRKELFFVCDNFSAFFFLSVISLFGVFVLVYLQCCPAIQSVCNQDYFRSKTLAKNMILLFSLFFLDLFAAFGGVLSWTCLTWDFYSEQCALCTMGIVCNVHRVKMLIFQ